MILVPTKFSSPLAIRAPIPLRFVTGLNGVYKFLDALFCVQTDIFIYGDYTHAQVIWG